MGSQGGNNGKCSTMKQWEMDPLGEDRKKMYTNTDRNWPSRWK